MLEVIKETSPLSSVAICKLSVVAGRLNWLSFSQTLDSMDQ